MIFINWNSWTSNKKKKQLVKIDPTMDVFSYKRSNKWRNYLLEIINNDDTGSVYFIPTTYPGNVTNDFITNKKIWIGLKLIKTNELSLTKYDEVIKPSRRWLYLKNYETSRGFCKELFRCTGAEHTISGSFWEYVYPCSVCSGTGVLNKYNIKWLVFSGHEHGVKREIVDKYKNYCENTGIPFYYERAWIGKTLIREPFLYGNQYIETPKNIFDLN